MTYEFFNWFTELGQLTSLVTFAVTVLGMLSLLLVNMGRYLQSKKFGIPLRNVHQANIAESAELWIALMGSLGFALLLPVVFLNVEVGLLFLLPIVFVFFMLGLIMTKHGDMTRSGKTVVIDGKEHELRHNITLIYYSIRSIFAAAAYARLHRIYYEVVITEAGTIGGIGSHVLTVLMVLAFAYYFYHIFDQLKSSLLDRLFGNTSVITAVVDGKNYFVAMRHNQYQWFLMEYEVEKSVRIWKSPTFGGLIHMNWRAFVSIARFSRGVYIIRDLSELEGPLESKSFTDIRDKRKLSFFTYAEEIEKPQEEKPESPEVWQPTEEEQANPIDGQQVMEDKPEYMGAKLPKADEPELTEAQKLKDCEPKSSEVPNP